MKATQREHARLPRRVVVAVAVLGIPVASCGRLGFDLLVGDSPGDPIASFDGGLGGVGGVGGEPVGGGTPTGGIAGMDASAPPKDAGAGAPAMDAAGGASATDAATGGAATGGAATGGAASVDASPPDAAVPCTWTDFGGLEQVTGLGLTGTHWSPALGGNDLSLYFGYESGTTDEGIRVATRASLGTAAFGPATLLPNVQSPARDGTPFVTADDGALYFFSSRTGGVGLRDLYVSTRATPGADFGAPTLLAGVNTADWELAPRVSVDGLRLWFVSDRPGGVGGSDFWVAERPTPGDDFVLTSGLEELNTSADENSPTMSDDELTIVFASSRPGGLGSFDLYIATRADPSLIFDAPVPINAANSSGWDTDTTLSADGTELFFSSDRTGPRRLYRLTRSCVP